MNARIRMHLLAVASVALLPLAGGCAGSAELRDIKKDIARQIPGANFDRQVSLGIGPGGMALARAVISFVPDGNEARGLLRDVSRLELSVYEIETDNDYRNVSTPARIE